MRRRRRRAAAVALLLAAAACGERTRWVTPAQAPTVSRYADPDAVCVGVTPALTPPDSLGPLRPGMTLADLEALCDGIEYSWVALEGTPEPVLMTRLGDVGVVIELTDTLADSRIRRVSTASPAARTADGVGPGSTLGEVLGVWPDLRIAMGEGTFGLSPSHPGISLELAGMGPDDFRLFLDAQRSGDLSSLPRGTTVHGVLLTSW